MECSWCGGKIEDEPYVNKEYPSLYITEPYHSVCFIACHPDLTPVKGTNYRECAKRQLKYLNKRLNAKMDKLTLEFLISPHTGKVGDR